MKTLFIVISLFVCSFVISKELPVDTSVIYGQLDNGFNYTIKHKRFPRKMAELRLVVKVGSLEEGEDQRGVAHFIEHMAFNGSNHFKNNEMIDYLESMGMKFGNHVNASTGYEETLYKLSIPLESDNLEKAFLMLGDWASGITFDENEFEKERGVILEEARQRNMLNSRLLNKYKHLFYHNTKFQYRLPIGDVKNVTLSRVKDFYQDWYRPEFMHLIAVGDFDIFKFKTLMNKQFRKLKNNSTRERALRVIPEVNKTRVAFITDKDLPFNYISLQFNEKLEVERTEEDLKENLIFGDLCMKSYFLS